MRKDLSKPGCGQVFAPKCALRPRRAISGRNCGFEAWNLGISCGKGCDKNKMSAVGCAPPTRPARASAPPNARGTLLGVMVGGRRAGRASGLS